MESDLSKKFSLDYLLSGVASKTAAPPASSSAQPDNVFQLLSQPILRKLETAPNRCIRVFTLIDQLETVYGEIRVEALAEIINRLECTGRIKVLQRDRYG